MDMRSEKFSGKVKLIFLFLGDENTFREASGKTFLTDSFFKYK